MDKKTLIGLIVIGAILLGSPGIMPRFNKSLQKSSRSNRL